ncbi:MAG TPA: hypothetical protein VFM68_00585 [Candidatus Saccharimonadales bacterium]|nr:hypothetical protein [Candidatus Saccharimonadales bacterium]
MTLTIKKRRQQRRNQITAAAVVVGATVLVAVPLVKVIAVQSPSWSMASGVFMYPTHQNALQVFSPNDTDTTFAHMTKDALSPLAMDCTSPHALTPKLVTARSSYLKKLAQYERVCGSRVTPQISFFVATPATIQEARGYAANVAVQLHEFAAHGIAPLVFIEPTTSTGLVDMSEYQAGGYDEVLDTYFASIKAAGITDTMMGTWVPFPEGNMPVWTSLNPKDFSASVIKTVSYQKKHFPDSKASILLDTLTYPSVDSWNDGRAVSLAPYVRDIPNGLIDSFGLQGFPWAPPANQSGTAVVDPQQYLRVGLAAEAAKILGVQDIWLNTGTFGTKYADKSTQQVSISPQQRLAMLTGVTRQAKTLQEQGFSVSIHLFAENKSDVTEATDWSYWSNNTVTTSPSTYVFKAFAHDLQANGIALWLFDTD